jgi:5-methylcytosine-specific restriction endonuclease McrA
MEGRMDKATYEKYVKLDCWSLRRGEYLKRHCYCEMCGQSNVTLQVHHLTYERLGREKDDDLVAVCVPCHRTFHKLPQGTPKTWMLQHREHMPDGEKKDLILKWLPPERSIW